MRFKITITYRIGTIEVTDTIRSEGAFLSVLMDTLSDREDVTALSIKPLADRKAYMRGYMQRRRAKRIERDADEAFEQARKDFGC